MQAIKRLKAQYDNILQQLQHHVVTAQKYGADNNDISKMKSRIPSYAFINTLPCYDNLDQVPEIISFQQERNTIISQHLLERGIEADTEYKKAREYIDHGAYIQALSILYKLEGYLNSNQLIESVNRYFFLSDVLDNNGQLYYYKQDKNQTTYSLYPTSNKKIDEKALIQKIAYVISNCANILYYIDSDGKLHAYDLAARKHIKLGKTPLLSVKNVQVKKSIGKAYLFTPGNDYQNTSTELYELNLIDGKTTCLLKNIKKVISFSGTKLAYLTDVESKKNENVSITAVFDIETHSNIAVTSGEDIDICGYTKASVIYTIKAPNENNKDIYSKDLNNHSHAILLEKNILGFCDIINNNVYYYIGNSRSQTLVSISEDGNNRNEISFCIKNILFQLGDWIYFIRGNAYNAVLCRAKLDGSESSIVAPEIKKFVSIKSGYLYYIDDSNSLRKVLMDGSYEEYLKHNVDEVLCINENTICYTAFDDSMSIPQVDGTNQIRYIKSIYSINTDGAGCRKLVYDIADANEYDNEFVYYTTPVNRDSIQLFSKLDVFSGNTDELLEIKIEPKGGCYIATSIYGSYDCPEVWRFRRFRDNVLANTWYGKAFIKLYYTISPSMVKFFGETYWFKSFFKKVLDGINEDLKNRGVDDSPYEDRNW